MKQCYPLTPPLSNIVLKVLAGPIREENEIKGIQIEKERFKLPLFTYDIHIYIYEIQKLPPENFQKQSIISSEWQSTKSTYKNT